LEVAATEVHSLCPVSGSTQGADVAGVSSADLTGLGDSGGGSASSRTGFVLAEPPSTRKAGDFVIGWTYTLLTEKYHY
jgi:hypothetical protein